MHPCSVLWTNDKKRVSKNYTVCCEQIKNSEVLNKSLQYVPSFPLEDLKYYTHLHPSCPWSIKPNILRPTLPNPISCFKILATWNWAGEELEDSVKWPNQIYYFWVYIGIGILTKQVPTGSHSLANIILMDDSYWCLIQSGSRARGKRGAKPMALGSVSIFTEKHLPV